MGAEIIKGPLSAADIRGAIWCGDAAGTANAISLTAPASLTLVDGLILGFRAGADTSGAATVAVTNANDATAKSLRKESQSGADLLTGNELRNNSHYLIQYRAGSGRWHILSGFSRQLADDPNNAQVIANAAAIAAKLQYFLTGGSVNAYTVTTSSGWASYVDGATLDIKIHTANTSAATLAVNGGLNKNLYKRSQSGTVDLTGAELPTNSIVRVCWNSDSDGFVILGAWKLKSEDIPTARKLKALLSTGQTVSGTYKLLFDTPSTNDGALTASGSTYTATRDMVVQVDLSLYSSTDPSVYVTIVIYKNGAAYKQSQSINYNLVPSISKLVDLSTGDTLEFYVVGNGTLSTASNLYRLLTIVEL